MIESATARRLAGDWAGACAAARVDVDLNLREVARVLGRDLAASLRNDLRHLAPDLLRWHLPRVAPNGLLRPGLTISLARYHPDGGPVASPGGDAVHLVVRTPPAWADGGQRISLALWSGRDRGGRNRPGPGGPTGNIQARYPHPRPQARYRLDLHRHRWDARRTSELRERAGADQPPPGLRKRAGADQTPPDLREQSGTAGAPVAPDHIGTVRTNGETGNADDVASLLAYGCAVDRWAAEARLLLRAEERFGDAVAVHLGAGRRLVLELPAGSDQGCFAYRLRLHPGRRSGLPVLPDAATWTPPDLLLLRAGLIGADELHPLVAAALAPEQTAPPAGRRRSDDTGPRLVECRGALHRIGLVDGVLVALDHDPTEVRREELLAALTGTPLPCLQAIERVHREPECLDDVRARLDHGDIAGALATVEALLGPEAVLRSGALRDELETAAMRRVTYGLFRAGLVGPGRGPNDRPERRNRVCRSRPRHCTPR